MAEDETETTAKARVGTVINGKWKVDRLIGVGGMASVYAATHRNSKKAALKIMHPELSAQSTIRERFLREGYLSNLVDHPAVVNVDDDDETEDGCAFLVMELVEGETLEARLRRKGPLPPEEVLSFMDQVLHALATAHTRGVIHRDLKPENMLLAQSGEVKLLDFGIARARALSTDPTKTLTEGLMGTPAFMPPEQARGRWEEVDAQSDVWALGATMFTLLTGRNVHQAATTNEALAVAMMRHAPLLEEYRPDLPSSLLELVNKALRYEKKDRWPNATVMLLAIRKATSRLEEDSLQAEASAAALAVDADSDFDGYMPEEDEAVSRSTASAPEASEASSDLGAGPEQRASEPQHEPVRPEPMSRAAFPAEELPTNPFSTEEPLQNPYQEDAYSEATSEPAASAPLGSAGEDVEATPLATARHRDSLSANASPAASTAVDSHASGDTSVIGGSAIGEPVPSAPSNNVPMSQASGSAPSSSIDSDAPEAGPEAAARYLSRKASAKKAPEEPSGALPARRVVPFSDVPPPISSEMVRPTETTTARGALTARVRSTSKNQRSLIGGAAVAVLLLLGAVFAFSGGEANSESEPAAAGNGISPLEPAAGRTPAVAEGRGQGALDEEPTGADPEEQEGKPDQESLSLEALPMLSASTENPAGAAPTRRWRPKPKAEEPKVNIFNKAKNLAVKRATVRSDKVKSGRGE